MVPLVDSHWPCIRPLGRPRTYWRDYILQLAWERLGIHQEKLKSVARDREFWADLLSLLPPQHPPGKMEGK